MTLISEPKKVSGKSLLYLSKKVKEHLCENALSVIKLKAEHKRLTFLTEVYSDEIWEKADMLSKSGKLSFKEGDDYYVIIKDKYGTISLPFKILRTIEYDKNENWILWLDDTIKGIIVFQKENYIQEDKEDER